MRALWRRLAPLPGGRRLFSRILGTMAPYTGTMGALVEALEPGYARIRLADRRKVRNHLDSIHAVALANLGELASGLALTGALDAGTRGIVTSLSISYLKKARGTLTAECRTELPKVAGETDHQVVAVIRNEAGEDVARTVVTWRLGPAGAGRAPA